MPEFGKQPRNIPNIERLELTPEERRAIFDFFDEHKSWMRRIGDAVLKQKLDEDYPDPLDDNPNIELGEN